MRKLWFEWKLKGWNAITKSELFWQSLWNGAGSSQEKGNGTCQNTNAISDGDVWSQQTEVSNRGNNHISSLLSLCGGTLYNQLTTSTLDIIDLWWLLFSRCFTRFQSLKIFLYHRLSRPCLSLFPNILWPTTLEDVGDKGRQFVLLFVACDCVFVEKMILLLKL